MLQSGRARETLGVVLAALAFGLVYAHPVVRHFGMFEVSQDWDQHLVYHWVPWNTLVHFQQVPHWSPYMCGGSPLLANPPTRILMPSFLLHLIAGPIAGLHLEIILHLALAFAGGWLLARVVGLGRLAAATTAVVYGVCSSHYLHVAVGHAWFMSYAWQPWVAAAAWYALAVRRLVPAALAGVVLAIQIGEGGIYPAPHAAILVVVVALGLAVARRDPWPLAVLAAVALFGFAFSAPRLLPTLSLMADHPRWIESPELLGLRTLALSLFWRAYDPPEMAEHEWGFHEYGTYLAPAALPLIVLGLVCAWRRAWPWALAGAVFLILALGDFGVLSPWPLLHRLPLFASHHVPSRFLTPFVMVAALLAGFGADAAARRWRRRGTLGVAVLALVAAVDGFFVGPPHLEKIFEFGPAPSGRLSYTRAVPPAPGFRQTFLRPGRSMFMTVRANKGVLDCYDPIHLPVGASGFGQPDYRGEQYLTGPGTVRVVRWSPNELEYEVDVAAPAHLVVNQNHHPPWQLVRGTGRVVALDGLLAVRLPKGRQQLVLRYVSWPFRIGVGLALIGTVFLVVLARREARTVA